TGSSSRWEITRWTAHLTTVAIESSSVLRSRSDYAQVHWSQTRKAAPGSGPTHEAPDTRPARPQCDRGHPAPHELIGSPLGTHHRPPQGDARRRRATQECR